MAPTPVLFCLENPMNGGAWWAAVHGVTKSQTRLSDFTFTFHFHALEKELATHSSVLAWRIPGTGEPGGLPSMGSHRVGHDWSDLAAAAAAGSSCSQLRLNTINMYSLFGLINWFGWVLTKWIILWSSWLIENAKTKCTRQPGFDWAPGIGRILWNAWNKKEGGCCC